MKLVKVILGIYAASLMVCGTFGIGLFIVIASIMLLFSGIACLGTILWFMIKVIFAMASIMAAFICLRALWITIKDMIRND